MDILASGVDSKAYYIWMDQLEDDSLVSLDDFLAAYASLDLVEN